MKLRLRTTLYVVFLLAGLLQWTSCALKFKSPFGRGSSATATAAPVTAAITGLAVFGQYNTLSGAPNGPLLSSSIFYYPTHVDRLNSKWIVVTGDNRVLIYSGAIGSSSYIVLGGTPALAVTASSLNFPGQVAWDGTHFIVVDGGNSRLLVWNSFPTQNYQPADVVIGQADFTSSAPNQGLNAPTASTLSTPEGVVFLNGKLIISDFMNNRILVYNSVPTTNGAAATGVIGQADFVSADVNRGGANPSAISLAYPSYLSTDGVMLIVADYGNNRMLIWNTLPASPATDADLVLGQTLFTTAVAATTQSGLSGPNHALVVGSQLYVTDYGNSRIQYWATFPTASGQNATGSIGQADFITAAVNRGNATPVSNGFYYPWSVATDGTKLVVADGSNNRLTEFSTFPTGSGDSATAVYGQATLTTAANSINPVGANGFNAPTGVCASKNYLIVADYRNNRFLVFNKQSPYSAAIAAIGQPNLTTVSAGTSSIKVGSGPLGNCAVGSDDKLYLSDTGNNRVLVYNQVPTSSGATASFVLGHDLFTQSAANDGPDGEGWLNGPEGLYATSTQLFVADTSNNRTLIFNLPITANHQFANVVVGQPDFTTLAAGPTVLSPNAPAGATTDGTRLFIGDSNRVMVYNTIPTVANVNADYVIGQPNFTSTTVGGASNQLSTLFYCQPEVIAGYLYIPDAGNYRIVGYDLASLATGMAATRSLIGFTGFSELRYDAYSDYLWVLDGNTNRVMRVNQTSLSSYFHTP